MLHQTCKFIYLFIFCFEHAAVIFIFIFISLPLFFDLLPSSFLVINKNECNVDINKFCLSH